MNDWTASISRTIEWQVSLLLTKTRKRLKSRGNWMPRSRDFLPQLTESHDANRFQSNRSERIRRSGESSKNCKVRWTPKTGPQVKMDFRRSAGEEKADYESKTQTA